MRLFCCLLTVSLWSNPVGAAEATRFVEYLHVEANEGDSSGGHAALRFGEETFHFQHETPGIIRLRRVASEGFDYVYAMLGNRTIRGSRISVTGDTYDRLRDAFNRLFLIQESQMDIRDSLHRDVSLFERLLRHNESHPDETDTIRLPLKGLGYFFPDGTRSGWCVQTADAGAEKNDSASPSLLSLAKRIAAVRGDHFLDERLSDARHNLRILDLQPVAPSAAAISPETYPSFVSTASALYEDALLSLYALEILRAAPRLRPETLRTIDSPEFRLDEPELAALQHFATRLENQLLDLMTSSRSDWAFPFIVGMARLTAIDASLDSKRLVLLDVGSEKLPPGEDGTLRPYLSEIVQERSKVFLQRRGDFFGGDRMREADYAALERVGNLLIDAEEAQGSGTALRKEPGSSFPSRPALMEVPVPGRMAAADLRHHLEAARKVEREYATALNRMYAYELVRRNCVTEIFSVINRAMAREASVDGDALKPATRKISTQRLGGYVEGSAGFSFIPFVSISEVVRTYNVTAMTEQLSYRALRLDEMKKREEPWKVTLRESNTLTSTTYRPRTDDSAFLFFTDDSVLLRPFFGAVNLLVGLGQSMAGIVTLPIEGRDRLMAGVKGMMFSIPELAFLNLRKGSVTYVERSFYETEKQGEEVRGVDRTGR